MAQSWMDQIRSAYRSAGETDYRVSQETGISVGRLYEFREGKNLSAPNLEILGRYLGFHLVRKPLKTISKIG